HLSRSNRASPARPPAVTPQPWLAVSARYPTIGTARAFRPHRVRPRGTSSAPARCMERVAGDERHRNRLARPACAADRRGILALLARHRRWPALGTPEGGVGGPPGSGRLPVPPCVTAGPPAQPWQA